MAATDLKVRVGFVFDEKSLNALSKRLQRSGEQLSRIGTDLTLSLSAPLAAFGAASIKAAGDIESLTLALKSQLGSSEAAAAELNKLTEAAKNPGLGVEQAVRGSVRLQGVGLAADEARETLIQMGNAIAATGGSAQELDNVTRQFAQMISKGRVLQEDVSILSENMPGLAQLMQKAFGTQSVEAIRAMGVGGKEFVQRITEAAKELPRVEGGIKNGIGNAMDSLKQSAAKVGLAINTAFNITGLIESLSGGLLAAANAFASLDSGVQKVILSLAGIVIATGPVVKAFASIKQFSGTFISIWASVLSSIKAGVTAFKALDTAMKLTVIGGLIVAVGLLAAAYSEFSSKLTDAERAQKSLSEVNRKAAESVAGQKSEVDTLVAAYKSEGATLDQKKAILLELNRISPEYFGGIRVGKGDIEAITAATAKYSNELIRVAKITAAKDRLVEIEKELLNLNKTAEPTLLQSVGNAILSLGNASQFAANQAKTVGTNIVEQTKALEAERTALAGLVTQQTLADAATGKLAKSTGDLSLATDKNSQSLGNASEKAKAYAEVLADIQAETDRQNLLGLNDIPQKLQVAESGLKKLLDAGWKPNTEEVKRVVAEVVNLQTQINALTPPAPITIDIIRRESTSGGFVPTARPEGEFDAIKNQQDVIAQRQKDLANSWRDTYISAAQEVSGALFNILGSSLDKRTQDEIDAAEQSAAVALQAAEGNAEKQAQIRASLDQKIAQIEKKAGKRRKAQALAEAIVNTAVGVTRAISSAPPPLNIPAIVAASVAGASQIAIIAATPFARGTGFAPGGMALVGEQGPELINLPRGSQVYSNPKTNRMLDNMGGTTLSGEFTVRGTDLVLVLDRAQNKNQRFR